MKSTQKILIGLVAFFTAGLVVGVLYAPDKGEKTRKKIARKKRNFVESATDSWEGGKDKMQDWRGKMMDKIETVSSDLQKLVK